MSERYPFVEAKSRPHGCPNLVDACLRIKMYIYTYAYIYTDARTRARVYLRIHLSNIRANLGDVLRQALLQHGKINILKTNVYLPNRVSLLLPSGPSVPQRSTKLSLPRPTKRRLPLLHEPSLASARASWPLFGPARVFSQGSGVETRIVGMVRWITPEV